jgi:hypothetical protein
MRPAVRWIGVSLMTLCLAGTATDARAQTFGVQGGLNFSTLSGDDIESADHLTGWQLGGAALLGRGRTGLLTGLLLTRKGASESGGGLSSRIALTYFQVPVLARFVLSDAGAQGSIGTHVYFGPAVAIKARCRVTASFGSGNVSAPCEEQEDEEDAVIFRSTEVSAIVGFGVDFEAFSLSIQYDLGLTDIAEDQSVKNRTFSLIARYLWR